MSFVGCFTMRKPKKVKKQKVKEKRKHMQPKPQPKSSCKVIPISSKMAERTRAVGHPSIAACMMVKDESENLHRCLSSIKDFVDEIVVVDTGSTDNTVEICQSFGAKIYHHPLESEFIDDFSKYRNLSIGYASTDWVFIIDADEELFFDTNKDAFYRSLSKVPYNVHGIGMLVKDVRKSNIMVQVYSSRMFRRGKIRYEDICHNQPVVEGGNAAVIEDVFIQHYGYDLTPEKRAYKRERLRRLLKKRVEQNSNDHLAYFYLTQTYSDHSEHKKAAEYGEKYLEHRELAKREGKWMSDIYYCMFHTYVSLNDAERANFWLQEGIKELPNDLDMAMALTEYGIWQRRSDLTVIGAKRFIELYAQYQKSASLKQSKFVYSQVPEGLAFAHFHYLLIQLRDVGMIMNAIRENLPKTKSQFREGMINDLTQLLSKLNLMELRPRMIPKPVIETYASLENLGIKIAKSSN